MSGAFSYRAVDRAGAITSGTLVAANGGLALQALVAQGLYPIEVRPEAIRALRATTLSWNDLAIGLGLLGNLLRAGLSLERALEALAECAPRSWAPVLPRVLGRVRQGVGLGEALQTDEAKVPVLLTAILDAGWAGAGAVAAIDRAAHLADATARTRAAIRQAVAYPIILLITGAASLGFLVFVVLPRFAAILLDLGQPPPTLTRLVLAAAVVAREWWLPGSVVMVTGLGAWGVWVRSPGGMIAWQRLLRQLPGLGDILVALGSARAMSAIGALVEAGVGLPLALTHGAQASGDAVAAAGLLDVREAVLAGAAPSRALAGSGVVTPTAGRLARAGEETGCLGAMMVEAGRLDQEHAEQLIRRLVRSIEPAFILLFGGLVGLIAAALLQALYGIRP